MLKKIMNRAGEPSTYAGVAGIMLGLEQIFDINESSMIVDAAQGAAQAVAATGSPVMGIALLLSGLLAAFLPEKKGGK